MYVYLSSTRLLAQLVKEQIFENLGLTDSKYFSVLLFKDQMNYTSFEINQKDE